MPPPRMSPTMKRSSSSGPTRRASLVFCSPVLGSPSSASSGSPRHCLCHLVPPPVALPGYIPAPATRRRGPRASDGPRPTSAPKASMPGRQVARRSCPPRAAWLIPLARGDEDHRDRDPARQLGGVVEGAAGQRLRRGRRACSGGGAARERDQVGVEGDRLDPPDRLAAEHAAVLVGAPRRRRRASPRASPRAAPALRMAEVDAELGAAGDRGDDPGLEPELARWCRRRRARGRSARPRARSRPRRGRRRGGRPSASCRRERPGR